MKSFLDTFGPELFDAPRDCSDALLIETCQRLLRALTDDVPSLIITDERVLRAIAYIEGKLHTSQTLDEVAREVCLSPSRFRHVFVEATGMALRPYVLWRRFLYVWELLAAGTSLSKAAHDASFADAAHLPRTSRTMFDFPPSALHIERPVAAPVVSSIRAGAQTTIRIPRPILGLRRPLSDRIVG